MADRILVIGSGVIGLTTAILLAEAGHPVRIRTAELPMNTTSVVAGALLGPVMESTDERAREWVQYGGQIFGGLAADPATGVRMQRGRLLSRRPGELPGWASAALGFEECAGGDRPNGFPTAFWVTAPVADMRRYLRYLTDRFGGAGGQIEVDPVASLGEAAAEARLVFNCTGVDAAALTSDDDLESVRGQHVVVRNPGLTDFAYEVHGQQSWVGYFAHGDRVVLCGVAVPGSRDREPDPATTAAILARDAAIEPRLTGARVLGVEVGLRPRRSRVRIEAEDIDGSRIVHHYGHGGNGVAWSWGSARDAVGLA